MPIITKYYGIKNETELMQLGVPCMHARPGLDRSPRLDGAKPRYLPETKWEFWSGDKFCLQTDRHSTTRKA